LRYSRKNRNDTVADLLFAKSGSPGSPGHPGFDTWTGGTPDHHS